MFDELYSMLGQAQSLNADTRELINSGVPPIEVMALALASIANSLEVLARTSVESFQLAEMGAS